MVTLQEAQQQVKSVETQLQQQEKTLQQQKQQIQKQKFPQQSLKYQQETISKAPSLFAGTLQQRKSEFTKTKQKGLSQIEQQRQAIQTFRTKQLQPYKQSIKEYEQAVQRAEQYNRAVRVYVGQQKGSIKDIPKNIRDMAKKQAESLERGAMREASAEFKKKFEKDFPTEKLIIAPSGQIEYIDSGILQMSITPEGYVPELQAKITAPVKTPDPFGLSTPYFEERVIDTFKPKGTGKEIPVTEVYYTDPMNPFASRKATEIERKEFMEQTNVLRTDDDLVRERENLWGLGKDIEKQSTRLSTIEARDKTGLTPFKTGAGEFGLGLASAGVGLGTVFLNPFKTMKEAGKGVVSSISQPVKTYYQVKSASTTAIKRKPSFVFGETVGYIYGSKGIGKGLSLFKKAGQTTLMTKLPSYEKYGERFEILPTQTVRTPLSKLRKVEGETITTTHVSFSPKIKYGSILKEFPSEAGTLRKQIGQYGFFQYPIKKGEKIKGLGGYAGLADEALLSESKVKFSLFEPKIKTFVFEKQFIKKTPKKVSKEMTPAELVKYQKEQTGTFIAPENIKRLSTEKQVVTAFGGKTGRESFKITKAKSDLGKFTYYKQIVKPTPFFEKGVRKKVWDIFTTKYKRVNILPAELEPVLDVGKKGKTKGKIVDAGEYFEDYGKTKYVSISRGAKSLIKRPIVSSTSKVVSPSSFGYSLSKRISRGVSPSRKRTSRGTSFISIISKPKSRVSRAFSPSRAISPPAVPRYSPPSFPSTPKVPSKPFLFIPDESLGRRSILKSKGRILSQQLRYTPSFTAIAFNIRGKKPKKLLGGYAPTIRPIINLKPSKKSKYKFF